MGPHSFKCGKRCGHERMVEGVQSFNGAALFQVRKAEMLTNTVIPEIKASMGPHSFKCGKGPFAPNGAPWPSASMGPHSFKCGKSIRPIGTLTTLGELQWGRTLSSAERTNKSRMRRGREKLQWGRTLSSAERSKPCRANTRTLTGFNGAALFQVRKVAKCASKKKKVRPASMGPHSFKCGKRES